MIEINTPQKLCSICGHKRGLQVLDCFDKNSHSKDGHRSVCKTCRKEQRYASLMPDNSQMPRVRQITYRGAKPTPINAKTRLLAFANSGCLSILFIGGFSWSTMNGSFAFLDIAQILSSGHFQVVAVLAASVLTLGTAISASWSAKVYRNRRVKAAILLMLIFSVLQSLNLIVNLSGVKKRLLLASQKQSEQKHVSQVSKLQEMKADYQQIIELYPPVNKHGNPVVWKPEITATVKSAYDEINRLNQHIMRLEEQLVSVKPQLGWHILLAWLVLPELCMLTAILVFALGQSSDAGCQEEVEV